MLKETSYLQLRLMPSAECLIFLNEIFGFGLTSEIWLRSYSAIPSYLLSHNHLVCFLAQTNHNTMCWLNWPPQLRMARGVPRSLMSRTFFCLVIKSIPWGIRERKVPDLKDWGTPCAIPNCGSQFSHHTVLWFACRMPESKPSGHDLKVHKLSYEIPGI